jgi:transposase InsO family protein
MCSFFDDFSRFIWIYFLRQKSEVFQHLNDFKALVETHFGNKIKILRTDNEGEYVNNEIKNIFHEEGIQLQHTVPYTPQQNGVAKQKKRSLKEMASCMLHANSLPQILWIMLFLIKLKAQRIMSGIKKFYESVFLMCFFYLSYMRKNP